MRVVAVWPSSRCILCRVRHTCVVDLSWRSTVAQSNLSILLRHVSTSRFRDQIVLVLLLLLKVRRDVERLDSAVVLRLHLLLESPLSLVSLMDSAVTCHASGTNRIVQETFRAHISVLEFVLNVCQLVFRRIWKARHDPTGLHVQLLANMQSILQDRSTVGLLRVIVVHATTGLVRGLNCSLTRLLLIIRVVSSFSQILELSLIVSGPTKLLVHPDT